MKKKTVFFIIVTLRSNSIESYISYHIKMKDKSEITVVSIIEK